MATTLYVVASPIGNLGDTSPRMIETLRKCALIAAEDTRVTMKLLAHFDIHTPMVSYYRHNEAGRAEAIIARMLSENIDVALISDAGTPCISDPGYTLVKAAAAAGIEVVPVCGPSAAAAALSISGFRLDSFGFFGFLPRDKAGCDERLAEILASGLDAAVTYESPRRVKELVSRIAQVIPGCPLCVCCDLTKFHELTLRGTPEDILAALEANPKSEKGEYTIVMNIAEAPKPDKKEAGQPVIGPEVLLLDLVLRGRSLKDAVKEISESSGFSRNEVYKASLEIKSRLADLRQGRGD